MLNYQKYWASVKTDKVSYNTLVQYESKHVGPNETLLLCSNKQTKEYLERKYN